MSTPFNTLKYQKESRLAFITLNRPERLNAINNEMPVEIQRAVEEANLDDDVHVIILSGEGRAFCSGYDMKYYAEQKGPVVGSQKMPWDPLIEYKNEAVDVVTTFLCNHFLLMLIIVDDVDNKLSNDVKKHELFYEFVAFFETRYL